MNNHTGEQVRSVGGRAYRVCTLVIAGAFGAWFAVAGAQAQTPNSGVSIGPSEALSPPSQSPAPAPEHLITQLDPLRQQLANYGVSLTVDWTAEVMGNPTGGIKQGATYAGQVGFEADIDWEKLAGIRGLSTHTVIVNREGSNVGTLAGDNINQVQEVYGAGGDTVIHFVYTYAEESLFNGRVDIAVGRYPVDNDFAASPLYCIFMSNAICGNPRSNVVNDIGLSSYPDAVWGGRVRARPTADTYIQAGVFQVNQGLYSYSNFRTGFKFDDSQTSGVEVPVEIAYEPQIGPQQLPGHYKLGFAYDSTTYSKYQSTLDQVLAGNGGTGNKYQLWALFDQMVVRFGPGALDGVIILGGYTHGDPSLELFSDQYFLGAIIRDFWTQRPQDNIGLLFSHTGVSGKLGKQEALDFALGLPVAGGVTGVQSNNEIFEVHYGIHAFRGVDFQPTFQYYIHPNAQKNIADAAFFGFKSHVNF